MSSKGNALISVILVVLGVVFIWFYDQDSLPRSIVVLCGLTFAIPAVISLLSVFLSGKGDRRSSSVRAVQAVCGVGGLLMGLSIILLPAIFRPLLSYPFSALMIVGGAFQIFQLSHKNRRVDYPSWMFIVPVAVLVAGVLVLCLQLLGSPIGEKWVVLVTGISALVYGLNGLLVSILPHRLPPLHPIVPVLPANGVETVAATEEAGEAVAPERADVIS